jgi:ATP-dependent helicase/nuclease subunit B
MAWVDWIREGFPQPILVSMVRNGLMTPDEKVTPARMARVLRALPIGSGRDRYLAVMDKGIRRLERKIEESRDKGKGIRDEEDHPDHRGDLLADLVALKKLRKVTAELLATCPEPGTPMAQVLDKAAVFLKTLARGTNRWDSYALEKFDERIRELSRWIGESTAPCIVDPYDWLREMAHDEGVGGSGPRPGCLHASRLSSGGNTGRPYTFIVGMDDSRHPGAGLQDPVLLDAERSGISPDLATAGSTLARRIEELRGTIARLRGEVIVSWPSLDLADDRELFPAAICQELMRHLTGDPDAQPESQAQRLYEMAGAPAAFTPTGTEACADETEWWLAALLTGDQPENALAAVHTAFPDLAHGTAATGARLAGTLTPWDGVVTLDPCHDPLAGDGPSMSATRLELTGRCPLAYFFTYLLKVAPPEDPGAEREVWLEPIHFGSLLHDVLHRFMALVMERGETPSVNDHMGEMERIAGEEAQRYREKYPPPDDALYEEQVEHLQEAVRVFLADEEEAAGIAEPFLLEQGVGLGKEVEPVTLDLPGGVTIRSRGRIDRIDRLVGSAHRFTITDYKSGSAYRYDAADPFKQGRTVQQALYVKLAESLLKGTVDPEAVVEGFNYYFPASKRVDEPVAWERDDLSGGDAILALLARTAACGAFTATHDKKDCGYCDYKEVCLDLEAVTKASGEKLTADGDTRLDSFRELRGKALKGEGVNGE